MIYDIVNLTATILISKCVVTIYMYKNDRCSLSMLLIGPYILSLYRYINYKLYNSTKMHDRVHLTERTSYQNTGLPFILHK